MPRFNLSISVKLQGLLKCNIKPSMFLAWIVKMENSQYSFISSLFIVAGEQSLKPLIIYVETFWHESNSHLVSNENDLETSNLSVGSMEGKHSSLLQAIFSFPKLTFAWTRRGHINGLCPVKKHAIISNRLYYIIRRSLWS